MTTPTQTKGQRSSLGLPVTSTPFSDLNAGYGPSLRTVQDENGIEETSDKRSGGHLRLQSGLGLELSPSSQYRRGVSRGPKLGH